MSVSKEEAEEKAQALLAHLGLSNAKAYPARCQAGKQCRFTAMMINPELSDMMSRLLPWILPYAWK